MTYETGRPLPSDLISSSAVPIQQNFFIANQAFGVDHSPLTDTSGTQGLHKKVTFPNAPAAPTPTGTISNMYPSAVAGEQEMIWKNATNTTQITSGGLPLWKGGTPGGSGVVANSITGNGYMTLPNGFKMQWGAVPSPGSSGTVTFPIAFTSPPFSIQITVQIDSSKALSVNSGASAGFAPTTTQFQYIIETGGSTTNKKLYWIAIGN